jgi:hypothetical protein
VLKRHAGGIGPFQNDDFPAGRAIDRGRIEPKPLTAPPKPLLALSLKPIAGHYTDGPISDAEMVRREDRPERLLMEQLHYNWFRWFGGPRMHQGAIGSFGCRRPAITYNLIGMAILTPAPFVCA